jgi:amidophosphoribosyltransferase
LHRVFEEAPLAACSFERIYFSRGNDPLIYRERKKLGELLVPQILEAIDGDLDNTVFSYIPNTAESAFLGMLQGLEMHLQIARTEALHRLDPESLRSRQGDDYHEFIRLMQRRPRVEKAAIKDAKLRTFITDDHQRNDLVRHVYDTTSGILEHGRDALVVMDDSIVRGTTLRESIVSILGGLKPRLLVVVSSAPTIRYPDCYGIDMSRLGDFIAFQALMNLIRQRGLEDHLQAATREARADLELTEHPLSNRLQGLYALVSDRDLEEEIARLITPAGLAFPIKVVYQRLEDLHTACPGHRGDWYFGGQYPTRGGHRVANRALVYYVDQIDARPY